MISGGLVRFMDATLKFPEGVGLIYATSLFWNGPDAYEKSTSRILELLISRSRVFFDVGSNVGIYAVYTGVKYPQITVYAFEPVPSICEKNRLFHRANQLDDKRVLDLALSDHEGRQEMIIPLFAGAEEEQQTATLRENTWQASHETVEKITVECTTLDAFVSKNVPPEGECCLKIDVEDHEAAVLRGGLQFIRSRLPWIVCEILPGQKTNPQTQELENDNSETLKVLEELNYTPFAITADGLFRMTTADFSRPRALKDFLLVPPGKLPANASYLHPRSLADLLLAQ